MRDDRYLTREQSDGAEPALSDHALMTAFAAGDRSAARDLSSRLAPKAYAVAFRMLGNGADAEDVTQEAMLRLWKAAPQWDQNGEAQPMTWLYRVVSNLCIDRLRRTKGRTADLADVPESADETPSAVDQMIAADRQMALQAALAELPDRQRQAVVLRHIENLSNPEIAGVMDVGVEAVESLTARGKRALVRILSGRRKDLGFE